MKHGGWVSRFEKLFAEHVGARYAIAMTNGTVTLEVALRALDIAPGDEIIVPPLTMAATSMAVISAKGQPAYRDVDPRTWLLRPASLVPKRLHVGVDLYGLQAPYWGQGTVVDAAQTLRQHLGTTPFTSYSFQRSKILNTGEGGMLVTNVESLATLARSIASLGYDMGHSARIDVRKLKSPEAIRHVRLGLNARMNDLTAQRGIELMQSVEYLKDIRQQCAQTYQRVVQQFPHLVTPQFVPDGWVHDYWAYTILVAPGVDVAMLSASIDGHGGEIPYGAWRLTFNEPAFHGIGSGHGNCPVARELQPRLLQFQTNDLLSAQRNATALWNALAETTPPPVATISPRSS